ncbi:hypothetical protein AXF42_Ash016580 [Apostasia shenzhenica]|uniref:Uncharacterized protein n=1 Tax=Apostasia shenzhenica TaxID=1088818 RepID=A0A2I0A1H0_9ASPA|nr:hypothetical protein AXF42_Ash016580 [Apostasia shenzhenica]
MYTAGSRVSFARSRHHLFQVSMKALEDVDVGCGGPGNTKERKRVPGDGGVQMGEPINRGSGGRFCPRQPEKHTEI